MGQPRLTVLFIAIVGFVAWAGCGDDNIISPAPTGSIRGHVTEIGSGEAVTDAWITFVDPLDWASASPIVFTDQNGDYSISGVSAGVYLPLIFQDTLVVFDNLGSLAKVEPRKTTTHDLRLVDSEILDFDNKYSIAGVVTDGLTGDPIAGAYVGMIGLESWEIPAIYHGVFLEFWALTDSLGRFSVETSVYVEENGRGELVERGLFPISVTKEGYEPLSLIGEGPSIYDFVPRTLPLPPGPDSVLAVTVALNPIPEGGAGPHGVGALEGRVVYQNDPVPNVLVGLSLAYVAEPDTFRQAGTRPVPVPGKVARTGEDGGFIIDGLTPGTYYVHPAYPYGDGYAGDPLWGRGGSPRRCQVIESDTTDVGDIEVAQALEPVYPLDGTVIETGTPELRWEPVGDTPYVFKGYEVQYGTGYILYQAKRNLFEPRWQMPDTLALPPGSHVRWTVIAKAFDQAAGDTISIGEFEHISTFSVAE